MEEDAQLENSVFSTAFMGTTDHLLVGSHADDFVAPVMLLKQHMNMLTNMSTTITNVERENHPKQKGFGDHLEEKDNLDFFRNLRVTKDTFNLLLDKITEKYSPIYSGGRVPVAPKLGLMLCLWYLGNKETYREIAELFGLSESAVFKSVQIVINTICSFGTEFIKWPSGDKLKEVEKKFHDVCGFPGVTGAIDGSHIEVKVPNDVQADFIDRTNRHSVNLMAVCDSEKRFTFINAGFPGSAHDSRVLKNTELHHKMVNTPSDLFPSNYYHIIGDSAFQLSNHLLVPFKDFGNLSETQRKYNKKLSQTRCIIENAFGWLKGRFRRLKYIDADLDRIPNIITACCIIHNITLDNASEEELLRIEGVMLPASEEDYGNEPINLPDIDGSQKRNFIATLL